MNLKLKFIGVDDNDVIATSGALCAYTGTADKFKLNGATKDVSDINWYVFVDSEGNTNATGETTGIITNPYMGAYYVATGLGTPIINTDGTQMSEGTIATNGNYYHYNKTNYMLYLCNDPSHTFGSFGK